MERAHLHPAVSIENSLLGKPAYTTSRGDIALLVKPFIPQGKMLFNEPPRLLEIGMGNGNAILRLIDNSVGLSSSQVVGTSLQPFPEHEELVSRGVCIEYCHAGNMPSLGKFDIIFASAVFQHVPQVDYLVGSMVRFSKRGSVFLFMDDEKTRRLVTTAMSLYQDKIKPIKVLDVRSDTLTSFGFARFN